VGVGVVSERYILVESPKKLRFKISVSIPVQEISDDSTTKEKFENVLKSKAPSWKITCTSFSWKREWKIGDSIYYDLITELIVQPKEGNVKPLVFAEFKVSVPSSLSSTAEIIDFDDVVAKMFSIPAMPIIVTFLEQEVTDYVPPESDKPSKTKQKFVWWIVILVGVIALLIFTMSRG
jgi:hypothetical protein